MGTSAEDEGGGEAGHSLFMKKRNAGLVDKLAINDLLRSTVVILRWDPC